MIQRIVLLLIILSLVGLWIQIGWYTLIVAPVGILFALMAFAPLFMEQIEGEVGDAAASVGD